MSDTLHCPTCGAVCRILSPATEGIPQLKAFQNEDAQTKIEQLKKALNHLQETLRTERATAKARILDLEAEISRAVPTSLV